LETIKEAHAERGEQHAGLQKTSEQAETLLRVRADKHARAVELLAGRAEQNAALQDD
jgi:hypothetical protein